MPVQMTLKAAPQGMAVKLWTDTARSEALKELKNVARLPITHSHVAATPNVHFGRGATVGSVITTRGTIIEARPQRVRPRSEAEREAGGAGRDRESKRGNTRRWTPNPQQIRETAQTAGGAGRAVDTTLLALGVEAFERLFAAEPVNDFETLAIAIY